MRRYLVILGLVLFALSGAVYAGSYSDTVLVHRPLTNLVALSDKVEKVKQKSKSHYQHMTFLTYGDSLKSNIERLFRKTAWRLVWKPSVDYRWVGRVRLTGATRTDILGKMLNPYPLKATFYEKNRVVVVMTRNKR